MREFGMWVVLFFVFYSFGFYPVSAQHNSFTIHFAGKEIGEINTYLTESENTQIYEVTSVASFQVLWMKYHRTTSNLVTYENETVSTSYTGVYMNNDLEDSAAIHFNDDSYKCYRHPDERFVLKDSSMQFTTVKLYFHEPIGVEKVYSERFLAYCDLEKDGKNKYKLYLPDGKINYYTYANKLLIEVFVDRTMFDLQFLKK